MYVIIILDYRPDESCRSPRNKIKFRGGDRRWRAVCREMTWSVVVDEWVVVEGGWWIVH